MNFEQQKNQTVKEALLPNSDRERILWNEIESADKPIVTALKRLNRILGVKFPNADISTIESCSGHVQKNGSIAYRATTPEFKDNKRETAPSIQLLAPLEKVKKKDKKNILEFLNDIFSAAASETNRTFHKEVVSHQEAKERVSEMLKSEEGSEFYDVLIFVCRPYLIEQEKAFDVLKTFWKNFGTALSRYDNLQIKEPMRLADFLPPPAPPGLIRPE